MAIDNLNFYSNGLPAGQLTDRYSSQPGCLKSKNLDIFSSSKSVKATAWSTPTAISSDIVKQDGKLKLKTDGKVYEETVNGDVLVVDPSVNFPVKQVSYTGKNGTYADAQRGTVKDMVVKNVGDEWQAFTVYTDRSAYSYNKTTYVLDKELHNLSANWDYVSGLNRGTDGYIRFEKTNLGTMSFRVDLKVAGHDEFSTVPIKVKTDWGGVLTFSVTSSLKQKKYYYDPELDAMTPEDTGDAATVTTSGTLADGMVVYIPVSSEEVDWSIRINTNLDYSSAEVGIDLNLVGDRSSDDTLKNGDFNEYYSYLPMNENRNFIEVGEYYWMPSQSFQILWEWNSSWEEVNGDKQLRWEFQQYMGWANPTEMTVIGMIAWNESIYMIGNMNGNGYIFPCDLTGGRGTPYIAYGCTFNGVTNIDYLMYLVGDDRGISQLWVFNQQELVAILGGSQTSSNDIIDRAEQYNFDGRMLEYRGDLVLTTSDNRVFQYGQTFGGKGGTFVNDIPGTITDLKVKGADLSVEYTVTSGGTTTKYTTTYQDDTPIKNYNTEWEAVYPIVLGNHLLEKEESDLYASYIIPSSDCKLEFRASANHYHFWTFKVPHATTTPAVGDERNIVGGGTGKIAFVERNDDYLTFKLIGKLPLMSATVDGQLIKYTKTLPEYISYSEVNHFRKIGEITASKFEEGEFRFTNLNNKLELPKSHSLQVKVVGKGNQNYTPELFALDLVANQRDRG